MKKLLLLFLAVLGACCLRAQTERGAGMWKTWFITSGKQFRLPPPPNATATKEELKTLRSVQSELDSAAKATLLYWNAGAPSYRWQSILVSVLASDTAQPGQLVRVLLDIAVYDATVAAWDTKYAYNRPRPYTQNSEIKSYTIKPESPSYPCEYSVAAGVAVGLISHFYPNKRDSVLKLALEAMQARVAAGVQYPSDTKAGFELGKKVAEVAIAKTQRYVPTTKWDGKIPDQPGMWKGNNPGGPLVGTWKTFVLTSGNQLRPPPPPDYKKDMDELRNFKPTFRSTANAFFFGSQNNYWPDLTNQKVLEYNIHLNPPRAARIYALKSIAWYDALVACWDAKYAYWGTRPDQYDTTYRPVLMRTPPFPGYPSGHAATAGTFATLLTYLFPAEKDFFWQKAKEAAESRFEGGIHFRTDNEVGLELGRKVTEIVLEKAKKDGADGN